MKGTLRYRAGAWRLQVYAGKDIEGKHQRLTRTVTAPNTRVGRSEAELELARFVVQVAAGRTITPGDNPTVAELLVRWEANSRSDWSAGTRNNYRVVIPAYILPTLGKMKVRSIRSEHIETLYRDLRDHGGTDGGPLAGSTVSKVHTILRSAFAQAVRWQIIDRAPTDMAKPPKVSKSNVVDATPEEVRAVFAVALASDPDFAVFLLLAAVSGARRSQVLGLRWEDVNLEAGVAVFKRAIIDGGPGVGLVEQGTKSGTTAHVSLPERLAELLRGYRAQIELDRLDAGMRPPVYVFERPTGEPWRPDTTSDRWATVRAAAKVRPELRLHSVRHYVVTALLGAGFDARTVADHVGHGNVGVTLGMYAHSLPARSVAAAELLSGVLLPVE